MEDLMINTNEPAPMPWGMDRSLDESVNDFFEIARIYHSDGGTRIEPGTEAYAALSRMGIELPPGMDIQVSANSDDTFHVVFPPDPNTALSDEMLGSVAGGSTASTVGSYGTASTIGCALSTVSSAGTASSVGSAGSAG
ncbi:MAG: hypothetical protein OXC11_11480 [Rhodospirillales bacterium]|nr:hypothetical protein [Rhodospirillales bacterium]